MNGRFQGVVDGPPSLGFPVCRASSAGTEPEGTGVRFGHRVIAITAFLALWAGIAGAALGAVAEEDLEEALEQARGVYLIEVEAIHDVRPAEPFPNYWVVYEVVRGTGDARISESLEPVGLSEGQRFWIVAGNTVNGYTELLWVAPEDDEQAKSRLETIVEEDRFAWTPLRDPELGMSFGYRPGAEPGHWRIRGFRDGEPVWTLTLDLDEPMEVGGGMRVEREDVIGKQFLQALPDRVTDQVDTGRPLLYVTSPATMRNGYLAHGTNHCIDAETGALLGIADASQGPPRGFKLFDRATGALFLEHHYEEDPARDSAEIRTTTVFDPGSDSQGEVFRSRVEYGILEEGGYGWIYHSIDEGVDANAFARDMLGKVGEEHPDENFAFSPFSILTAFGMTYAGARSETAAQMEEVFHFPGAGQTHPALGKLAAAIEESVTGEDTLLRLANRIWLQDDWPAEEDFLGILDEHYRAPLESADFLAQPDVERLKINEWVYDRTQERIEDLLPPGLVTPLTRFVLVNALYFKAPWANPFDPDMTVDAPFEVAPGVTRTVRMMYGEQGDIPYVERDSARAIALPVDDGDFSLVVVLPNPGKSLDEVRAAVAEGAFALDYGEWSRAPRIDLFLPRFRVEGELDMKELLQAMGMVDAFEPGLADFSGIYTGPEPELHLSAARHKAFVEVTESGLEAAAATAVVGGVTSVPPQFRVDRPFLFFLAEDRTGTVLFSGQVIHPKDPDESSAGTSGDPSTFDNWRDQHFDEPQRADPAVSGPEATPAGDQVENLLKFFLGLDPHAPSAGSLPVPRVRTLEADGGEETFLTLRFTRPTNREGVVYRVCLSNDLENWDTEAVLAESVDNGDGTVTETWRDTLSAGESTARFAKLVVVQEPN